MSSENATDFRNAMRRLASGVALLTTFDGERRLGIAMTALMSLSLDPPSLTIAVNRSASIWRSLDQKAPFCVNLLKYTSEPMCRTFAALPSKDRFSVGEWADGPHRTPYLINAQAAIFCEVGPMLDFGTHTLFVGVVCDTIIDEHVLPLVHLDGGYVSVDRVQYI